MNVCKLYKKLADKKVQCTACANYCNITEGAVGTCGVRQNVDGTLYLLNYGKIISIGLDPIEKKPLYHYYPGSKAISISGLGCNFKCSFCQNWDISQFPMLKTHDTNRRITNNSIEKLGYDFTPDEFIKYCIKHDYKYIAYTYNEPTISLEYFTEIMKLAMQNNIKNIWVTNGYISKEGFENCKDYIDAANIDLKSFDNEFYRKHCKSKISVKSNSNAK